MPTGAAACPASCSVNWLLYPPQPHPPQQPHHHVAPPHPAILTSCAGRMSAVQRWSARPMGPLLQATARPPWLRPAAAAASHSSSHVQRCRRMSAAIRLRACKQVFGFRHFELCQDGAAMKVGTDAMILGAWAQPPSSWSPHSPQHSQQHARGSPSDHTQQQQQQQQVPCASPTSHHLPAGTGSSSCLAPTPAAGDLMGGSVHWAPAPEPLRILDIGTGTGVLALMMAQTAARQQQHHPLDDHHQQQQQQEEGGSGPVPFLVDALEVEAAAAQQAAANAAASPWGTAIRVHHASFQEWVAEQRPHLESQQQQRRQANTGTAGFGAAGGGGGWYHTIVCNPPFFERSSKPADAARALARHADSLPLSELVTGAAALLHPQVGSMFVILPCNAAVCLAGAAASKGLHVQHVLRVFSYEMDPEPVRLVLQLARDAEQLPLRLLDLGQGRVIDPLNDPAIQQLQAEVQKQDSLGRICEPAAVDTLVIRQQLPGGGGRVAYTEQYKALTAQFHHPSAFR